MSHWFALRARHQHEKAVHKYLTELGFESFLPLYRTRRRWSDRVKELELPLFGGYVFCRFALPERAPVLKTPGVRGIVSLGPQPAPVSEEEIAAVKQVVASGLPVEPWPFLKQGQTVRIRYGPLRDLEGGLVEFKGAWRVVVNVTLLQRSVAAEVDRSAVVPVQAPWQLGNSFHNVLNLR